MFKSLPSRPPYLPDYANTEYACDLAEPYNNNVKDLQASIQEALTLGHALNQHDPVAAAATTERIAIARFRDRGLRMYRPWTS